MVIEVVPPKVGEDSTGKIHTLGSALVEGVRAHLDGSGAASVFAHFGKELLKVECLRSGVSCGGTAVAGIVAHRAEQSATKPAGLQQGLEKHRGGGFSVGAGDADDLELAGGMAVEVGSHAAEGAAAAFHPDVGNGQIGETFFRHDGDGTPLESVGNKGVAILLQTFPGAEDGTGRDATRVIGKRGDFRLRGAFPGADLHAVHHVGQLHGFSRLATTAPRFRLSCSATCVAISRNAGAATWPP